MWIILIGISVGCFLLFWLMNRQLYKKEFESSPMDSMKVQLIDSYCTLNGNQFALFPRFSNFTFCYLRITIRAAISIVLMEFLGIGWIFYIYLIFPILTYSTYSSRKDSIKRMDEAEQSTVAPVFKAARRLPVYEIICGLLVFIEKVSIG